MVLKKVCLSSVLLAAALLFSCTPAASTSPAPVVTPEAAAVTRWPGQANHCPRIASWLAKKDEIIAGQQPFDLLMTAWFTPEEAAILEKQNSDVVLLAGLSVNWVWDDAEWLNFLTAVANYGRANAIAITEEMYLHNSDGSRCAFGFASEAWGHGEIYAMDPRNPEWVELITSYYKNALDQPQHDGIIIDMVTEVSWCPETISNEEWINATRAIMSGIHRLNALHKPVVVNAGRDYSEVDAYRDYFNGYLMENFMGGQVNSTFADGLNAFKDDLIVIYAVDTDDTGVKDLNKMRLGLVLSLLFDNTYFAYDFGPRDHGQAWWFPEYDVYLGLPLGPYYRKDNACFRDFEKGTVVAAPYGTVTVAFNGVYSDLSTGEKSASFTVNEGDGRIFIKSIP